MKILGGKNDFIPNLATSTVLFHIPFRWCCNVVKKYFWFDFIFDMSLLSRPKQLNQLFLLLSFWVGFTNKAVCIFHNVSHNQVLSAPKLTGLLPDRVQRHLWGPVPEWTMVVHCYHGHLNYYVIISCHDSSLFFMTQRSHTVLLIKTIDELDGTRNHAYIFGCKCSKTLLLWKL